MPYIGHEPTNAGSFIEIDDFSSTFNGAGDNGTDVVAFTLQVGGVDITPNTANVLVMLDGVLQQPPAAYSISGSTITFTEAPASGTDLYAILIGQSASVGQGTITAAELAISGNGTNNQLLKTDGDGTFSWINQNTVTASTAATLATARAINGVNFDGSAAITVTSAANTLTGNTLASGVTASSLTSVGTLTGLATSGNVGVGSATTSSPSSASRTLRIQHASGSASLVLCGDNDNETAWDILANTSGQLDMRKNNSSKLLIETDGTVVTSGALQPGGNVTIAGNLTVNGTGSDVITGDYLYLDAHNNTAAKNLVFRQLDDTWLGQIEFSPSGTSQIVTRVNQPLAFGVNNSKKVTIGTDGNTTFAGNVTINSPSGDTGWGFTLTNSYSSSSDVSISMGYANSSNRNSGIGVSMDDTDSGEYILNLASGGTDRFRVRGDGLAYFTGMLQAKRGFTAGQALDIEGDTFGRTNSGNIALGYRQDGNGDLLVLQQSSNNVFNLDGEGRTYLYAHSNARTSLNVMASGTGQAPNDAKVYAEKNSSNDWSFKANAGGDDYGYSTNGAGNYALYVTNHNASSAQTFRVEYDGDILAANTSISSISDRRLKKEITNASSQWDDIKALNFVNYKWKKSTGMDDSIKYLGLVADEVESVSPSLIKIDAQSKEDIEAGVEDPEYKTVKYSIVWMKAVKALQEAMAKIETLEAKVKALENA